MPTLREIVNRNVREGDLYEKLDRNRVRCYACGHCCPIADGQPGVCKVRYNQGGTLYVPWGYVGGVQCDPIEKKPFFHAYPGALAYSFGMLGCDLHCAYCQNWVTSQALRDPNAVSPPLQASPEALVEDAVRQGAKVLVSVSPYIPWHVTAFHKDYKMDDPENTRPQDLLRAAEIGRKAGLRYVYAGNLPGNVGGLEDTRCHQCGDTLIRRHGYLVQEYRVTPDGRCPSCKTAIPGRWAARFEDQIASHPFLPRRSSRLVTIPT